jgi:hypothetical protein
MQRKPEIAFDAFDSRAASVQATQIMEVIPPSIMKDMPALYATEHLPLAQKIVRVKLFVPWSSWTWYLIECEPDGPIAWGLVVGHENEFGYIDLNELESVRGPGGLTIERDLHFTPCTIADLVARERISLAL